MHARARDVCAHMHVCVQTRTDTLSLSVTTPPDQSSEEDFIFSSEILHRFCFLLVPVKIHDSAASVILFSSQWYDRIIPEGIFLLSLLVFVLALATSSQGGLSASDCPLPSHSLSTPTICQTACVSPTGL